MEGLSSFGIGNFRSFGLQARILPLVHHKATAARRHLGCRLHRT